MVLQLAAIAAGVAPFWALYNRGVFRFRHNNHDEAVADLFALPQSCCGQTTTSPARCRPAALLDRVAGPLLNAAGRERFATTVLSDGRVAQRESTVFTRQGSLVQSQPRPPLNFGKQSEIPGKDGGQNRSARACQRHVSKRAGYAILPAHAPRSVARRARLARSSSRPLPLAARRWLVLPACNGWQRVLPPAPRADSVAARGRDAGGLARVT
jgi:hypothetical protein